MTEITPEFRMRALELADRTVHQPYMSTYGSTAHNGGAYDNYRDKDMEEIFRRAQRILNWCHGTEDQANSLIDKLRGVLCEAKS